MLLLAHPTGNFPLNDDWVYARSVYNLSENGILRLDDLGAMTLVAQTFWGALIVKLFCGFSFTVLRYSIMLVGLLGLFGTYCLADLVTGNSRIALWTTVIMGICPLYFSLSCSFMTDVPFYTCSVYALLFLFRADRGMNWKNILAATVFCTIAILVRQIGLLLPLSFFIASIIRMKNIRSILSFFIPLCAAFLSMHMWIKWQEDRHILPFNYGSITGIFSAETMHVLPANILFRGCQIILLCGTLLFPILVPSVYHIARPLSRKKILIAALLALVLFFPVNRVAASFPVGNIIGTHGIGTPTLRDALILYQNAPVFFSPVVFSFIKAVAVISSLLLIFCLFASLLNMEWRTWRQNKKLPLLLFTLAYIAFLFLSNSFFDRYLLILLPCFVLLSLAVPSGSIPAKNPIRYLSIAAMLLLLLFSVGGTRDYFSWNRARWDALAELKKEGVTPAEIDGGYEFNGWNKPGPYGNPGKSWWFVHDDKYTITFGPINGYHVMKTFSYRRTFSSDGKICIMQRDE